MDMFLSNGGFSSGGGAVFMIDPIEINKIVVPIKDFDKTPRILDVINDANIIDDVLHNPYPPVCFSGLDKEKRISRQAGKFTTTGTLIWPMDFYNVFQEKITKIFITYSAYESIRRQLRVLGVTHDTIYIQEDEKDVIAKTIADDAKRKFSDLFN